MNAPELRAEVAVELEHMARVVSELNALRRDVGNRRPMLRETVAAGSFLMQFYNGVENMLKRISVFHSVPLPRGDGWHAELFSRFCDPPHADLPALFGDQLARDLRPFRAFRHVARTNYGVDLDWAKVAAGVDNIASVFERFRAAVYHHIEPLG